MGSAEPSVKVTLKGAPDGMPGTVLVGIAELSAHRLKIPFRAGYEHFVLEGDSIGQPAEGATFVWCDRTKVAE